jgi:hypothetical protein
MRARVRQADRERQGLPALPSATEALPTDTDGFGAAWTVNVAIFVAV